MKFQLARGAVAAVLAATIVGAGGMRPPSAATRVVPSLFAQADGDDAAIKELLRRIEQAARAGDPSGYLSLLTAAADRQRAADFAASEFRSGAGRVVIQERERRHLAGTLSGTGYTLLVDAFVEYGGRGRVGVWQLDVKRVDDGWLVADETRVSAVENLYRLTLNSQKQFEARNFTVVAEDLELTLVEGSVFVVETQLGVTALVLLGRGDMRFHPDSETEKGQVRIFAGADAITSRFDAAFVRVGTFEAHADPAVLKPRPVDPRELKRAEQVFREESVKSFSVDLADLTRDTWSLLPGGNDFLAEIRTRRFDTLTYARSTSEAEDISFFERRHHKNIAVYTSKDKLAARGPFYSEDDLSPFDVLHYDIDIAVTPERSWIEGKVSMRLRVRAISLSQLTIRLAESLTVRSVVSPQYGRLYVLRVTNQNTILVNLPVTLLQDAEMNVTIEYGGRVEPQPPDRETLMQRPDGVPTMEEPLLQPEANYLYSNGTSWYPQAVVTDYATARIQISVPAYYGCVATGEQAADSPRLVAGRDSSQARKVYVFTAERPLRYLGFVVSRLARADRWNVVFDASAPARSSSIGRMDAPRASYPKLDLVVEANPRQIGRGKDVAERAVDIVQFYQSIVGDAPYPTFTVALLEGLLPGGHSPGYFAVVNQTLPNAPMNWRNDPAAFPGYPEFFLAHEVAHQWWGQAVGWRNYHEQWLSEGFAQYFAALYAEKFRGRDVLANVLRQMRRWAMDESDQGPVYLGYRVGHIKSNSRVFRAIVYNKGAAVLHMLRRLIGDDAFFRGIRRFYTTARFTKAGTNDLRAAMEAESGRSLERFFDRWILNTALPKISFSYRVESVRDSTPGNARSDAQSLAVLHFEQTGQIFDLPLAMTLEYVDGKTTTVVVELTEQTKDFRVPLAGKLRSVELSKDDGTLAEVERAREPKR